MHPSEVWAGHGIVESADKFGDSLQAAEIGFLLFVHTSSACMSSLFLARTFHDRFASTSVRLGEQHVTSALNPKP